jgi:hypothetical protein
LKLAQIAVLILVGVVNAACGESRVGPMLVLASHMEGNLVDKDMRPAANVRVERTWDWGWNGKTGSDVSTTDAQGRFEFPKVNGFSLFAKIPLAQPQVAIRITADGPEGAVVLFSLMKVNYADRGETDGKPFKIVCRLDLKPGPTAGGFWGTVIEVK